MKTLNYKHTIYACFTGFVDKTGYRISIILAHVFAAAGLIGLTVLPELFRDPFCKGSHCPSPVRRRGKYSPVTSYEARLILNSVAFDVLRRFL